jgi:5-methyltetrahydropteroyltriglutamate--homocysteine methyltransferase
MTTRFHAEVIGSLLRPHYLSQARARLQAGLMPAHEFKRIEDRAVDEAIALQEGCGLQVVTDGELRRFSFLDQLLSDVEGVIAQPGPAVNFHGRGGEIWEWHAPVTVTGKFRGTRMLTPEEYTYARSRARQPVKVTLPSPLVMYSAWSPELSAAAYRDAYEMFADAADVIRAEARALAKLGCTYIQIDSPDLGTLADPENRTLREQLGMPTERTLTEGVDIINSVCDVPGVTFGLHLCKGNYQSKWIGSGGYDLTAEAVFSRMRDVDVFLLEYDDERSGTFEPLRHVPEDKVVVLGLVSSKTSETEPVPEIVARVTEAAKYVDLERLALSTQCGFASVSIGANLITSDTQERKLELVATAAAEIWLPEDDVPLRVRDRRPGGDVPHRARRATPDVNRARAAFGCDEEITWADARPGKLRRGQAQDGVVARMPVARRVAVGQIRGCRTRRHEPR